MLKKPFFSIVIPTYNRASDLQFALYCIFQQTFSDFEVVISDNCSTDNTKTIVNELKDKRIHYSRTTKTIGNAMNIRRALEAAKGEYIFIHSDDDFLLYSNSLAIICKKIQQYNPGYIRVNYVSLSQDKKRIFFYRISKPFTQDECLPPSLENERILSIILKSDPYFISGMIFRNEIPKSIKVIDTDPVPCIELLFYVVRNFGAYSIAKPHIAASWSRRKINKNTEHHFYTLIHGKLRCEKYLEAVKKKVNSHVYRKFLHREFMHLYVIMFPAMKALAGNKKTLQISSRISLLDPTMKKNVLFWASLLVAVLLPGSLLRILRDLFLSVFSRFSKLDKEKQILTAINNLELKFQHN